MHEPLISVIIPTFNRSNIVINTIRNVMSQTWSNLQIIIIDDCSTDETKKVILAINDFRINYIKTKKNIGCAGSRTLGIQNATGEFVTFLDDDDLWDPNYIRNQFKIFKQNPLIDVVICNYIVQKNQNKSYVRDMKPFAKNFKKIIHQSPGPFFQCSMFKHSILNNIEELLDSNAIPSEDWDFFMNLSMRNPLFEYSEQNGFIWNYTQSSQSANLELEGQSLSYIVEKHKQAILQLCGKIILSNHYRKIASIYENAENINSAKKYYYKAFYTSPWWWKNIIYYIIILLNPSMNIYKKFRKI